VCPQQGECAGGARETGEGGTDAHPSPLHCFCPPGAENPSYATASGHALSAARTGRMYSRTDIKTRAFHASSGLLTSSSVDAEALSWTTCTVPPPSSVSTAQAVVLSDHTDRQKPADAIDNLTLDDDYIPAVMSVQTESNHRPVGRK